MLIDYQIIISKEGYVQAKSNDDTLIPGKLNYDHSHILSMVSAIKDRSHNSRIALHDLGRALYDILFPKESVGDKVSIQTHFYAEYKEALKPQNRMRLILRIDNEELQMYPWELIHNGQQFLTLKGKVSIVRHPQEHQLSEVKPVKEKLNILIIESVPQDREKLEFAQTETEQIGNVFKSMLNEDTYSIEVLSTRYDDRLKLPTLKNIQKKLKGKNIVHYIGHSSFNPRESAVDSTGDSDSDSFEEATIDLCDDEGIVTPISHQALSVVLKPEDISGLGLVILNSCESGIQKGIDGLAKIFAKELIPCVIGMQFKVLDRAAPAFAEKFYSEFIRNRFNPEVALSACRDDLYTIQLGPDSREFACPVIYYSLKPENNAILSGFNFDKSLKSEYELRKYKDALNVRNTGIIISIDKYPQDKFLTDNNAGFVAESLYDKLKDWPNIEFIPEQNYIKSNEATSKRIRQALSRTFRADTSGGSVIIYYNGSLCLDEAHKELYLCPVDIEQDPYTTGISFSELDHLFSDSNKKRLILLLDCYCRETEESLKIEVFRSTLSATLEIFSRYTEYSQKDKIIMASLKYESEDYEESIQEFSSVLVKSLGEEADFDKLGIIHLEGVKKYFDKTVPEKKILIRPNAITDRLKEIRIGYTENSEYLIKVFLQNCSEKLNIVKQSTNEIPKEQWNERWEELKTLEFISLKKIIDTIQYLKGIENLEIKTVLKELKSGVDESLEMYRIIMQKWFFSKGMTLKAMISESTPTSDSHHSRYNTLQKLERFLSFDEISKLPLTSEKFAILDSLCDIITKRNDDLQTLVNAIKPRDTQIKTVTSTPSSREGKGLKTENPVSFGGYTAQK